jgi:hypothetical protein
MAMMRNVPPADPSLQAALDADKLKEVTGSEEYVTMHNLLTKEPESVRPITPPDVAAQEPKFLPDAWRNYTVEELGFAIAFSLKKSKHRSDKAASRRSVAHARAYADMILSYISAREKELV